MQNVIVWRDGKVTVDGQLLRHIVKVEHPTFTPDNDLIHSRVTFDVVGTFTYSDTAYASTPQAGVLPPEPTLNQGAVERLYAFGHIDYKTYCTLLDELEFKGPRAEMRPEPPQPVHPDTVRVIKVKEKIIAMQQANTLSVPIKNDLLSALL